VHPTVSYEVLVTIVIINAVVTLSPWRMMATKADKPFWGSKPRPSTAIGSGRSSRSNFASAYAFRGLTRLFIGRAAEVIPALCGFLLLLFAFISWAGGCRPASRPWASASPPKQEPPRGRTL